MRLGCLIIAVSESVIIFMQKNILILLSILVLLPAVAEAASKFRKGGGFSSRSRDSDGFGSFGKRRGDSDGFTRRPSAADDDFIFKSKGFRRTNFYAGKKIEKFGDNFGRGIGSFFLGLFGVSEEVPKTISGKRVKSSISVQTSNHDLTYDLVSNLLVGVGVVLVGGLLYWVITKRPFSQSEDDLMIRKARNRYADTYKNYEILQYIQENGVHPDRATGEIYKIRL